MPAKHKTLCVMGLGYIGLPTSTLFASRGLKVAGVDKNPEVVKTVNNGKIHIVEPDLEGLVAKVVQDKALKATDKAVKADAFIITVPTPIKADKTPDMTYVEAAAKEIAPVLEHGNLVIIESTSPVGTTEHVAGILAKARKDLSFPQDVGDQSDIRLAYCPERVLPGRIITELMDNDRIIGGMTPRCASEAEALYRTFVRGNCYQTGAATAELVKLTENAYRDTNIAFANELSLICDKHRLNVWDVIRLANCHPRVNILRPGAGVGGHCIAVDPWFIVSGAPKQAKLIKQSRQINDSKPGKVVDMTKRALKRAKGSSVAVLGLAYKPDVDDLRESPAVEIAEALAADSTIRLNIAEPHITTLPKKLDKMHTQLTDGLNAILESDIILVLVSHRAFSYLNKEAMGDKTVLDVAGLWEL